MDKRTFLGTAGGVDPLVQQAADAMRKYHDAKDAGAPAEEVERLRLLAEAKFQALSDLQVRVGAKS